MEFEAAVLHGAYDVGDVGEPHERRRFAVVIRLAARRVLLEETVVEAPAHAFDDGDRPRRELRQQPRADALVIANDVELRMPRGLGNRTLGMADRDAGDANRRRGRLVGRGA